MYKSFADTDGLGFVLKAMVVSKFGLLWEPVLKSATGFKQQVLPILQWNTSHSSHQEPPALLMAAMINIVVVVMAVEDVSIELLSLLLLSTSNCYYQVLSPLSAVADNMR